VRFAIVDSAEGAILAVRAKPGAGRSELLGAHGDGALKAAVRAAPERGKANAELLALLARALGCARGGLEIVGGEAARQKRVRFRGLGAADLEARLCRALSGKEGGS
jgi:uncharacterized protein (TIGR00251 family)